MIFRDQKSIDLSKIEIDNYEESKHAIVSNDEELLTESINFIQVSMGENEAMLGIMNPNIHLVKIQ